MLANTLAPLAAVVPSHVYAEGTGASEEEIVVENKEESASGEEADTEETADGQDLTVEEDKNEDEKTKEDDVEASDTGENKEEENGNEIESENPDEDEDVVDPEAPDIIKGGGVSDYRSVADIEDNETVEVGEIPMPVKVATTESSGTEPATVPSGTEPITTIEISETEPSPVVDPEVSVIEEPVGTLEVKKYETLAEDMEVEDSTEEYWNVDGEVAKTINKVKLGVKYIFPLDKEVSVTFTKLPELEEDRDYLKIERVKVDQLNLPADFVTNAEYAFDITIVDENGDPCEEGRMENKKDFEYDLTLPKPEGKEVEIVYIEKDLEEVLKEAKEGELKTEEIKEISEGKIEQEMDEEKVEVKGLDHFTLFVVSEVNRATYWDWASRTKQWTIEYERNGFAQYKENPTGNVLQKGREIGLGSDYILMRRPGTGRAYLGYDGFDSTLLNPNGPTLSETLIKEISWQSYPAKSPNDHYLNIYLFKPKFLGFDYATIVYVPSVGTANEWNTYSTDSPGLLYVKKDGTNYYYNSMSALINDYGNWKIRPDESTKSGITIVSGSSDSGPEIENYIDNVKIYYTNGEVDTYTFENSTDNTSPIPSFSTTISSPTNQTSIPVNLTFNEDVYGLEKNDFVLTNATIPGSITKVSQSQYQININPVNSGEVIISIPQGAVFDATGNPNTFASFTIEYAPDTVAPTSNISIQADLNETPDLTHNNGWHGEGWYYNFDKILLSISNPESGDFIQYQIMDGDSSAPGQTWISAGNQIDLAQTINGKVDGIYTIFWYAKDSAGNTETTKREVVKIDRTSPTYTIDFDSINGLKNNNVTYIKDNEIQIKVNVGDALSGYTRARYDLHTANENWNCTYQSTNEDNLVPAKNSDTRTLTVSGLSDGRYCLKIWVYDDVQNKASVDTNGKQWVHFIIDNTPPVVSNINITKDNKPVTYVKAGDTITITADVTDDNGVSAVSADFSRNENYSSIPTPAYITMTKTSGNTYQAQYTVPSSWTDGTMYIKVAARDLTGGNWVRSTEYKTVIVDNTPPSAPTIISPSEGSYFNSTPILNDWSDVTTDTSGIAYYRIEYVYDDGHNFFEGPYRTTTDSQRYHIPADNEQGGVKFRVQAFDNAGNEGAWSGYVHYYFDKTPPSAPKLTGNPVQYVKWGNVTRTWLPSESTDVDYYMYKNITNGWTSGPYDAGQNEYSITHNTGNYDRIFEWKVSAVDYAGNETWSENTYKVVVDNTPPISIITIPANDGNNSVVYNSTWSGTIAGTASDNISGVFSVKLSIKRESDGKYWNGGAWVGGAENSVRVSATVTNNSWSYSLTSPLEDTYTIISHSIDQAGNVEDSYQLTIVYDKTIPEITLTTDPTDPDGSNDWFKTKPTITLTATDSFDIDRVEYQWGSDTGSWTTYTSPFKPDSEGKLVLYYRSIDKAGNESVGVKNIKVDTDKPSSVSNVEATYNENENSITLDWDVEDSDIKEVRVYKGKSSDFDTDSLNRISKQSADDENYTDKGDLDISISRGNTYYYKLVAIDSAGNRSNTKKVSIEIPEEGGAPVVAVEEGVVEGAGAGEEEEGQVAGEETGPEGEGVVKGTEGEEGSVLGEETAKASGGQSIFKSFWFWLILVVLGALIIWLINKKSENGTKTKKKYM